MSDEDNTKMYIGLAVLVVAIGYYYMFMMTPSGNIISSNSYVLQNAKNGGCLTHEGYGKGPIVDLLGSKYCDPNSSQFSKYSLWKFTQT